MIKDIQQEILRLKKEKDICILAHSYVAHEIIEIADFTGDSYALSVKATTAPQKTVIMVGVRFMAETVKILSPEKKVILAQPIAGCPMAEQMDKELICAVKKEYPDYKVVAYINTTADLKTVCDVCVTSSSAVKIIKNMDAKNILFIPDCNLGHYVSEQIPEKNFKLLHGGCPIHASVSESEAVAAKEKHPGAKIWMATTKAKHSYTDVSFGPDDFIMFGKESAGIPEEILVEYEPTCIRIPMLPQIRSLNLSNSVAIVLYEALRQNNFESMEQSGNLHRLHWKSEEE